MNIIDPVAGQSALEALFGASGGDNAHVGRQTPQFRQYRLAEPEHRVFVRRIEQGADEQQGSGPRLRRRGREPGHGDDLVWARLNGARAG
ncbi:MAG: hypothetical protein P4N60_09910 [Verrucomicrobiae bacterium]|nr:hypothetical protein [Verrucomicrobiae bacterium]